MTGFEEVKLQGNRNWRESGTGIGEGEFRLGDGAKEAVRGDEVAWASRRTLLDIEFNRAMENKSGRFLGGERLGDWANFSKVREGRELCRWVGRQKVTVMGRSRRGCGVRERERH